MLSYFVAFILIGVFLCGCAIILRIVIADDRKSAQAHDEIMHQLGLDK